MRGKERAPRGSGAPFGEQVWGGGCSPQQWAAGQIKGGGQGWGGAVHSHHLCIPLSRPNVPNRRMLTGTCRVLPESSGHLRTPLISCKEVIIQKESRHRTSGYFFISFLLQAKD